MKDRTIIYYSGNTEDPVFENRIIEDLKQKAGDIPIVSVTRKPLDLGINVCVGTDKPFSYTTEWNQLLLGLRIARTKFCIAAESDCLYPPEYFQFTPPDEKTMYNYTNIWLVWKFKNNFWKKTGYCEGAQMCGRQHWLNRLEPLLPKDWGTLSRTAENTLVKRMFDTRKEFTGRPVISFKTRDGVSFRSTFVGESKTKNIPYWGSINKVKGILL